MSRRHLWVCILTALIASGAASANPVSCEQDGVIRRIEVVYAEPGQAVPCEVVYDKSAEGSIETVWRSNFEAGYCEARATELIDKLSGMGWLCASTAAGSGSTDADND